LKIFFPLSYQRFTLDSHATRFDKLTSRGKALEMSWSARDRRIAPNEAKVDRRIAPNEAKVDRRIAPNEAKVDRRIAPNEAKVHLCLMRGHAKHATARHERTQSQFVPVLPARTSNPKAARTNPKSSSTGIAVTGTPASLARTQSPLVPESRDRGSRPTSAHRHHNFGPPTKLYLPLCYVFINRF
jgi:hypothetical protein